MVSFHPSMSHGSSGQSKCESSLHMGERKATPHSAAENAKNSALTENTVAMTRARRSLTVIGDAETLQ